MVAGLMAAPVAAGPWPGWSRLRALAAGGLSAAVVAAGLAVRQWRRWSPFAPGLAGAAAFSTGVGEVASHVFGHGLAPWVGISVGGLFALAIDRQVGRSRE